MIRAQKMLVENGCGMDTLLSQKNVDLDINAFKLKFTREKNVNVYHDVYRNTCRDNRDSDFFDSKCKRN